MTQSRRIFVAVLLPSGGIQTGTKNARYETLNQPCEVKDLLLARTSQSRLYRQNNGRFGSPFRCGMFNMDRLNLHLACFNQESTYKWKPRAWLTMKKYHFRKSFGCSLPENLQCISIFNIYMVSWSLWFWQSLRWLPSASSIVWLRARLGQNVDKSSARKLLLFLRWTNGKRYYGEPLTMFVLITYNINDSNANAWQCKNCICDLNSLKSCSSKCALKCQKPQKCHSCRCDQEGNLCDHDCRICKPEEANEPNQHCDACPFLCADNQCDCFAYATWGQCLDGDDADCVWNNYPYQYRFVTNMAKTHSKQSCGEYVNLFCVSCFCIEVFWIYKRILTYWVRNLSHKSWQIT